MSATATPPPPPASAATPTRRAPRSASGGASTWPRLLAAVHAQGSTVRLVVARQDAAGSPLTLVDASTFSSADTPGLAGAIAKHKPGSLVRLVPSSRTVARAVQSPAGVGSDRAQLAAALELVAESELPSSIPSHRRAAGVIHPGVSDVGDSVIVVGWPVREGEGAPIVAGRPESWTPEIVALASLSRVVGGAELAVYADRDAGSIALLASVRPAPTSNGSHGGAKTVIRVLRGDTTSETAWRASLHRALAETSQALGVHIDVAQINAGAPAALALIGASSSRSRPFPSDPSWLNSYGIAFGALVAAIDADPAAQPLASLRQNAPKAPGNAIVRAVEWLAPPKRAAIVVSVCLLLFLLWPLVIAQSRELILSSRAGGRQQLDDRLKQAERRAAFYKALREKRWPMTKLVADIACAAPPGVSIDTLNVSREQGLSIRGHAIAFTDSITKSHAEATENITKFRTNLVNSGVFGFVTTPTIESESDEVTFQLDAQVVSPQFTGPRSGDFVKDPLAVRLYGERARRKEGDPEPDYTAPVASSSHSSSRESSRESSGPGSNGNNRNNGNRGPRGGARNETSSREDSGSSRRPASSSSAIPDPISDADIAKLDKQAALKEWTSRKNAASKPDLDAETKRRLTEESDKCKARFQELNKG